MTGLKRGVSGGLDYAISATESCNFQIWRERTRVFRMAGAADMGWKHKFKSPR